MRALTELELRRLHTTKGITSYPVPAGTLVTPAALQFARDNGIELKKTGGKNAKPEEMTHLMGDKLVPKTHPRIVFRGKVDTLQAQVLAVIIEAGDWSIKGLPADLEAILKYLRILIRAEVTETPLPDLEFRGWNMDEIKARSHYPERYFGIGHLFPASQHGIAVARLNLLRTLCRETELAGVAAFTGSEAVRRQDLITGLNRLNSLFYVMMIMIISDKY